MIHRGFLREKILCSICAGAFDDFRAIQFSLPGIGQSAVHVARNRQRVGRLPGLWLVTEKRKFQREILLVLLDKLIHAAGIGFHHLARFRVEECGIALRSAGKTVCSKLFVDGKRSRAQYFRELSAVDAAKEIHLPEAALRHYLTLAPRQLLPPGSPL